MEDGTTRARLQPDAENRFVRLRAELGVTSFGLNQIVLHAGQRGRIHAHERQEEVYLVLEGTLSLFVEGEEATLERGERDPRRAAGVKRQLVNRGPGPLHLLAIGGAGEHEGRDGLAFTRRGTRPTRSRRRRWRCRRTCRRRSGAAERPAYWRWLQSPSPVGSRARMPSKNSDHRHHREAEDQAAAS